MTSLPRFVLMMSVILGAVTAPVFNLARGSGPLPQNKVSWAGYTSTTYNGNMGGISGMNAKCQAAYTGSHVCHWKEIVRLGASYPWSSNAWAVGLVLTYDKAAPQYIFQDGTANTSLTGASTCAGWTSGASTNVGGNLNTTGGIVTSLCNTVMPIACCL